MKKMSAAQLQRRKAELKKMVHAEIVRREVMQFRLEPHNIEALYELAIKNHKPVGTLLREWVTEKIKEETHPIENGSRKAMSAEAQVGNLRKPLERLKTSISIFEAAAKQLEHIQAKSK